MDFCNLNYVLLVCKTFLDIFFYLEIIVTIWAITCSGKMTNGLIILVNKRWCDGWFWKNKIICCGRF